MNYRRQEGKRTSRPVSLAVSLPSGTNDRKVARITRRGFERGVRKLRCGGGYDEAEKPATLVYVDFYGQRTKEKNERENMRA